MPEWLKGTDCKSVGFAYAGSNPAPSTNMLPLIRELVQIVVAVVPKKSLGALMFVYAGVAQW